jgi:hypothetical protein
MNTVKEETESRGIPPIQCATLRGARVAPQQSPILREG